MLRIVHLTDTHVTAPRHRLFGLHTPTLLRRALAEVKGRGPGFCDALVITGDLTDRGEREAYEELARCLAEIALPVFLAIGNHDDRENFRAVFGGEPRYATGEFVQYAIDDFDPYRLIVLDTNRPGAARGLLCETRLAWLDETLAARPGAPTLVFLHHVPFTTHIRGLDAIGLDGADGLCEVLARHPRVLGLYAGHVHRTMHGRLGGLPVVATSSTCHQTALDFEAPDLVVAYEPPKFGVIVADGDAVVCHTAYFTESRGPRFSYPAMRRQSYDPA
ncbi:MAG: phosphodiesterase [Alphaproteobacteria bacterium]